MGTEAQIRKSNGTGKTTYWTVDVQDRVVSNPDGTTRLIPGSGHYVTDVATQVYTNSTSSRSSVGTPGFNSPNRPEPLPNNTYSFSLTEKTSGAYWRQWNTIPPAGINNRLDTSFVAENYGLGYPMPGLDLTSRTNSLINAVNNSLLLKMKDMSFNAAQATAERKQTSDLLAKTATRVAQAMAKVKKGDIVGAGKALGVVPSKRSATRARRAKDVGDQFGNAWLELNYGWKPLLNDVYGAAEALAKANNNRLIGKVKAQKSYIERSTSRVNNLGSAKGINEWTNILDAKITVKGGLVFEKSSPPVAQLSTLGITNPALIAWELMPYSFVVDWFVPIGNWLSTLDATLGLEFRGGYMTVFIRSDASSTLTQAFTQSNYTQVGYGRETMKIIRVSRSKVLNFPSASFPAFKNPVSASHVASAMALLSQVFRGK